MASQKSVETADLHIVYEEGGISNGTPVLLLHGWPYDVRSYDSVRDLLIKDNKFRILIPYIRGHGLTKYRHESTLRSGQQAAVAQDALDFLDALKIDKAIFVGYDWGGRAACIVAALYPDRVLGLLSCQGYAIQNIPKSAVSALPPDAIRRYWYQSYFNTEQGPIGLREHRKEFTKLLWQLWSPDWNFNHDASASSFDSDDWIDTTIHSYRHRYGNERGDEKFEHIEKLLEEQPKISVPTFVVAGKADGVEPPDSDDGKRSQFEGHYERILIDDVGHCPPAEAPEEVSKAINKLYDLSVST